MWIQKNIMIKKGMWSREKARCWEEGFPGGNGRIGVMVMGNPAEEKVIVNHERLFLPMHGRVNMPDMSGHLPEIRNLIRVGKYRDAAKFFVEKSTEAGLLPGIGPDYFHPAFDLKITMPPQGTVSDCLRSLDFTSGEIVTSWFDGKNKLERRLFVSRPDNVIVMVIRSASGKLPHCGFQLTESGEETQEELEDINKYVLETESSASRDSLNYRCKYRKGDGYSGAAKFFANGGNTQTGNGMIIVDGASEILIIASVSPDLTPIIFNNISDDYNILFERHKSGHCELFNRVIIDLNGGKDRELSNEELIAKAQESGMSAALAERLHNLGRYLLICSSGELPPNAQGIWNGSWKITNLADYVMNIELEMATWPALQSALPECLAGYFNFIESFLPDWRENARNLYGCRGVLASSRSSNHGQLHHFSEEYPHMFWTAGATWMAQAFYDYWLFTGDKEFLLNRALPLMKETALFYEDYLIEGPDGRLQFIPSVSPENNPGNTDSQVAINATMDIAIAKELFHNLIDSCQDLNIEAENITRWIKLLKQLPEYQINPDGALAEWADNNLEDHYPHRHVSHFYPAMPGFEAQDNPELAEACKKAIEMRLKNDLLRRCGWSLGHAVNAAARLKDGNLVYKFLSELAACFVNPALLTGLTVDGRFQADANLGFTAAVMEALVFSLPGRIELLPALPPQWKKGRISGVKCRGGVTVKNLEWNIESGKGVAVFLSNKTQQAALNITGLDKGIIDLHANEYREFNFTITRKEL